MPWRRRRFRATYALASLPLALVLAWPAASVQAAAPASVNAADICLVFCNNVIAQPTPCVAGVVLCSPLPASPCVAGAVLCPGDVVTLPTATPTPTRTPTPTPTPTPVGPGGPGPGPGTTGSGGGGGPAPIASTTVALLGPPGVGLVPRLIDGAGGNPGAGVDPYAELLSLSIRDGLRVDGYQLWPLLAALQAILLVLVVGAFSARRLLQTSDLPGD